LAPVNGSTTVKPSSFVASSATIFFSFFTCLLRSARIASQGMGMAKSRSSLNR